VLRGGGVQDGPGGRADGPGLADVSRCANGVAAAGHRPHPAPAAHAAAVPVVLFRWAAGQQRAPAGVRPVPGCPVLLIP
jgi:hypothetical protein